MSYKAPSVSQYWPTFREFQSMAQHATVVPVSREVVADSLQPLVACATVANEPGSYLLESVVGGERHARYSFVGFAPEVMVRGVGDRFERVTTNATHIERGVDPWKRLESVLAEWKPPAGVTYQTRFWGGAVGYVSYDAVRRFEPTVAPPLTDPDAYEFSFAIGGTVLVFDNLRQTMKVLVPTRTDRSSSLERAYDGAIQRIEEALERLSNQKRLKTFSPPSLHEEFQLPSSSFDEEGFCNAVNRAKEYIRAGDAFQIVLSQRFRVPANGIDMLDVYRAMRLINPSPYMYFLRFPEVSVGGASPETLVRIENGVVEVRPIAGTRERGETEEEDRRIAEELLADPKERAEHVMLVDLGRNDVGRISVPGSVQLTETMAIERYSHVMHVVSNVTGKLKPDRNPLDVLRATFPAGTLSGAPKVRAMQIINELEPEPRGIYGGAIGYIGFDGNMDFAIAIRTLVQHGDELLLQAGAGIVEASDPRTEYQETINKARAGLVAVRTARRLADSGNA